MIEKGKELLNQIQQKIQDLKQDELIKKELENIKDKLSDGIPFTEQEFEDYKSTSSIFLPFHLRAEVDGDLLADYLMKLPVDDMIMQFLEAATRLEDSLNKYFFKLEMSQTAIEQIVKDLNLILNFVF